MIPRHRENDRNLLHAARGRLCLPADASVRNAAIGERSVPPQLWVSPFHFGINQGPLVLMIEYFRTGLIWNLMRRCPHLWAGLDKAGFVDGTVTLAPDLLVVVRRLRNGLVFQTIAMHADDQRFLIVRPIEDRDPSALRQIASGPPEKVVFQLRFRGLFEAVDPTTLRIDAGHHMPDCAVLPRGVGRLEDQQNRMTVGGVMEMLHFAELGDVLFQQTPVLVLGFVERVDFRRPLREIDLVALR
jgi:hypothetical protein